jgi:hypothetical protein
MWYIEDIYISDRGYEMVEVTDLRDDRISGTYFIDELQDDLVELPIMDILEGP